MCGARTDLGASDVSLTDVTDARLPTTDAGVYCSLHYGNVSGCDGSGSPWILECMPGLVCMSDPYEKDDAGQDLWGCCYVTDSGVLGTCSFADPGRLYNCPATEDL